MRRTSRYVLLGQRSQLRRRDRQQRGDGLAGDRESPGDRLVAEASLAQLQRGSVDV
jgi:hypothetical protein